MSTENTDTFDPTAIPEEDERELQRLLDQEGGGALRRDWKLLPKTFPYLRPYRRKAAVSILLTVLSAAVALAQPWPLAFVIDQVLGSEPVPGWLTGLVGNETVTLILVAVVATLLLTALAGGLTVINEYLTTTIEQKMSLNFRSDLFQHLQRASLAFHDTHPLGILMYRFNTQASAVGAIIVGLPAILQSVLTVLGMAVITFTIDPLLALLALGVTPFIFYSTTFYTDRIEPQLYRVRGMEGMNMAIAHEAMAMLRVIVAFGREKPEYQRFRRQGEAAVKARIDLTVRQTAFQLAVQLITAFGTAAVLGVGAYQATQGQISPGELLVVLTYIAQVYQPLEELTQTITSYQQYFISLRHSLTLLDEAPQVEEKPGARRLGRASGALELEGINFSYEEREHVLKDISFKVEAGEAVALVGPTGAGKSTLASLLPRLYDPAEGRVLIDGNDVRDLKLESVREQFSIVLQEPLLFSTSILQNIRYGKPDATREEVVEAAKAANIHDFIQSLPEGYKTSLGERGTKISGGERQRIAVARAFLRDAPFLILDEPTSSIDSRTESVILDALDRLMEGRTTIVIAHRLSTLRSVDRVLVLNEGELVEQGAPDELLAESGLFRELWEAQTAVTGELHPEIASGSSVAQLKAASSGPGEPSSSEASAAQEVEDSPPEAAKVPHLHEVESPRPPGTASLPRPKIVLLGLLTKIPVGGVAWLVGQYATGFERLGYEVYYVEAHARTPSMFMQHPGDDGASKAAKYIAEIARRFGLEDRWAFQALHENGRCYGMSPRQLDRLYADAALIINMHGGTLPLPEHAATDRLVFLGTDPVEVELEVHRGEPHALQFLDQHSAHFTWGLNYGNPDCELPWAHPFQFVPSPPPVVLDFWENEVEPRAQFTTIGNWRQPYRNVRFEGQVYRWSKHEQFLKVLDLPRRVDPPLELALSSYDDEDHLMLAEHGWRVRPGFELSRDLDAYHDYIVGSAGELSVAKEQNVHFRSGWFSERSATYLAAGRPVVVQDTGFGSALPTGEGLFAFSDEDSAAEALSAVSAEPERHRAAARDIAREYLSHEVVLGALLDHVGLRHPKHVGQPKATPAPAQLPRDLSIEVLSRKPLQVKDETAKLIRTRPIPAVRQPRRKPEATVVMPVLNNLICTRLALESVLANTEAPPYAVIVVDNGSSDPTRSYLEALAARNPHVRVIRNGRNQGFAAATNQGLKAADGETVVLLNNDTVVPPGWLAGLVNHLEDDRIGIVGATTNRCGGGAQIPVSYETYGEMLDFARLRHEALVGRPPSDIPVVEMFCAAFKRSLYEEIGPLDERFEVGMFEDDDYVRRVREAGYRVVCAEDVFVHHFGEASLGKLAAAGTYGDLFHANRQRFEEKWGVEWEAHGRRHDPAYAQMAERIEVALRKHLPRGSTVLVVSRGDEELVAHEGHEAWHFPRLDDGTYAGHHPADDAEAISELERLREQGADYLVLPATSRWWLDHYEGLRRHLERYRRTVDDPDTATIFELAPDDGEAELRGSA